MNIERLGRHQNSIGAVYRAPLIQRSHHLCGSFKSPTVNGGIVIISLLIIATIEE